MKFATSNPHKYEEAKKILGEDLIQIDIDVDEIQAIDVMDIVKHKAKWAFEVTWEPIIVEDTWLHFEGWNNFPGALIKWVLKTLGRDGILQTLSTFENRNAKAVCCVGYFDGKEYIIAQWEITWSIATKVQWDSDFGWDPLFIPEGETRSFAQMSMEEKNAISHRGNAFREFAKLMK